MPEKVVRAVRPSGVPSVAEWTDDQHRLIERSSDELRDIARELLIVRTQLFEATYRTRQEGECTPAIGNRICLSCLSRSRHNQEAGAVNTDAPAVVTISYHPILMDQPGDTWPERWRAVKPPRRERWSCGSPRPS